LDDEEDIIAETYKIIWEMIRNQEFQKIDDFLRSCEIEKQKSSVLLSILTITAMSGVEPWLPYRKDFYNRVERFLIYRHGEETAGQMLIGLK
jgi:hypothetical protein